jgi:hypothetical protein
MAAVTQPTAEFLSAPVSARIDKHVIGNDEEIVRELKDDLSDNTSEHKQEGVKQVEAITQVWSKKLLWAMFFLYVSLILSSPHMSA